MCDKCENNELFNSVFVDMKIDGARLIINYDAYSVDSSFLETIEIKYCMNCGKKLSNSQVDSENTNQN